MKSSCFALAALAAIGFSGAAFAEEATTTGTATSTPVTAPIAMTDAEMDKVTAGTVTTSRACPPAAGLCGLGHVSPGRKGDNIIVGPPFN